MVRISLTDRSMRSVPSLDSELPRWISTADTTTKEKSWRNSDCQFSSVDCPNATQNSEKRAACPCACCSWTKEDHSASPCATQLTRNSAANVRLSPKFRQILRMPESRRSWTCCGPTSRTGRRTSPPGRSMWSRARSSPSAPVLLGAIHGTSPCFGDASMGTRECPTSHHSSSVSQRLGCMGGAGPAPSPEQGPDRDNQGTPKARLANGPGLRRPPAVRRPWPPAGPEPRSPPADGPERPRGTRAGVRGASRAQRGCTGTERFCTSTPRTCVRRRTDVDLCPRSRAGCR